MIRNGKQIPAQRTKARALENCRRVDLSPKVTKLFIEIGCHKNSTLNA